jgi:hypothetical protein
MERTTFWALLGMGALVFAALFESAREQRATLVNVSKQIARIRSELADVKSERNESAEIGALSHEVQVLKSNRETYVPSATQDQQKELASNDKSEHATQTPLDPQARAQQQRAANKALADKAGAKLDSLLRTESIDRDWSTSTIDGINRTFSTVSTSHVTAADCRTNFCRIVIQHDSSDDQHELAHKVLKGPPFDQEMLFRYDFDSSPPETILTSLGAATL